MSAYGIWWDIKRAFSITGWGQFYFWQDIKLMVACLYDKNPDYCWSELVNWATRVNSFWSLFWPWHPENIYKEQGCRARFESTPYAYCGKCEKTGNFNRRESEDDQIVFEYINKEEE
jgi:hypothetical protein